ncbi:Glycosyltransferase involved in cell wall bisynthesis [Humidesulfovibrio mexicanus]|uniref:Glycosyltransferase involved in cell wall bisynthesis n=1 Tax=Humidesulfovibrio mexicanus TaxID=147047 RepID=A0A238Z9P9_9BACT|nr:glycosyltransferase family 4 protein [Humidesulfovibrio mexicanus]SNR80020.1 Glycosyltransferase involved in cell wall bisynthesis [Humidesulfovibrio mexicanus]
MSGRVRVLHVLKSLGLGGTEKVAQSFLAHLDRDRFETAVHSPEDGPRAAQIRQGGSATFVGMDLGRALSVFRPQVVHLHRAGWPEPEFLRPVRDYAARNPVLVVETNVFGRHDPSPSGSVIDTHLFVSHFCAERYARHTGVAVSWPRYGVLYNPVDTDFFAAALPDGPQPSEPVVGRISRADPGKWSRLALEILPILARATPGFRYRVVGGVPEAMSFVRAHGLSPHVEFLPPLSTDAELAGFYGGLAVLAHANDAGESFGLVIAEAMACGLPVVTHPSREERDNAQVELVEHGVTGLVAETAEEYAACVRRLLENSAEARAMGLAGRDKARRLYRAQDIAGRLGDLYEELLARKREGA